jgi:hypothetical protein
MIHITTPTSYAQERRYILDVIFQEFLGISYTHEISEDKTSQITLTINNRTITLPDTFFRTAESRWLKKESLPYQPLNVWQVPPTIAHRCCAPTIPIIYGVFPENIEYDIPIDIFGSAFFMLTRYEEVAQPDVRDKHDRFPATAALAYKGNFLDRPIINEYIEILWHFIKQTAPSLKRKSRKFRFLISCDVDHPFDEATRSCKATILRICARIFRDRNLKQAALDGINYLFTKFGCHKYDSYHNNIFWMMQAHPPNLDPIAFYFIPNQTSASYDKSATISSPKIKDLITQIVNTGHEVGIHPGYNTYKFESVFSNSVAIFKNTLTSLGYDTKHIGGRQHYLRYDITHTPRLWAANGLKYDSSLSFAEMPGFRCGVCYEFTMFDLINRVPLSLTQRPLIVMECTILSKNNKKESLKKLKTLKKTCEKYNGDFTLLWHNSFFHKKNCSDLYKEIIKI